MYFFVSFATWYHLVPLVPFGATWCHLCTCGTIGTKWPQMAPSPDEVPTKSQGLGLPNNQLKSYTIKPKQAYFTRAPLQGSRAPGQGSRAPRTAPGLQVSRAPLQGSRAPAPLQGSRARAPGPGLLGQCSWHQVAPNGTKSRRSPDEVPRPRPSQQSA